MVNPRIYIIFPHGHNASEDHDLAFVLSNGGLGQGGARHSCSLYIWSASATPLPLAFRYSGQRDVNGTKRLVTAAGTKVTNEAPRIEENGRKEIEMPSRDTTRLEVKTRISALEGKKKNK